jgi:hypothetical protein
MNNEKGIISVSDKLIGSTGNRRAGSYWGHYFKARHLMASGDMKEAAELLLGALENIQCGPSLYSHSACFTTIVEALDEICLIDPSLIGPDKVQLIEVARIVLASD